MEVNCETGEETVRPLTAEELAQHAKDVEEFEATEAAREAEAQAKADAKAAAIAKLAALGLTEEEATALAG
jgi:hypothetical protein